jgi:TetR/AcrR family transcriptional repressor of mexCD-oprJ operon
MRHICLMTKIRLDTKDAILQAGFDVFGKNSSASLDKVAKRAGVGRATLHRYYSSRDDLIEALAWAAMDELNKAVEEAIKDAQSYTEGLKLALAAIVPLSNRQLFLANEPLDHNPKIAEAYFKDKQELVADIEKAKLEGTFAKDIPSKWIAESFEALIYAAWIMVKDGEATHKQAADLAWRTLTAGLSNQKST